MYETEFYRGRPATCLQEAGIKYNRTIPMAAAEKFPSAGN
jgi:hypothetical protein